MPNLVVRVNETLAALKALYSGNPVNCFTEQGNITRTQRKKDWERATEAQKKVVAFVCDWHVRWSAKEELQDGSTALGGVLRAVPTSMGSEKRTDGCLGENRGDVCQCHSAEVSLPPVGSVPIGIDLVSPIAAEFLENWQDSMLLSDDQVDWETYHGIKLFQAPELNNKNTILPLLLRLWQSGMLSTCQMMKEEVSVFTVLKKFENGTRSSRLVWDLRRANLRWKAPPWVPLGSPISMACFDLAEDLLQRRVLSSCQGDLPDFFYTLELPPGMGEWLVFDGVTTEELVNYAKAMDVLLGIPSDDKHLQKVLAMGWSWAVFLAHSSCRALSRKASSTSTPVASSSTGCRRRSPTSSRSSSGPTSTTSQPRSSRTLGRAGLPPRQFASS